MTVRQLLNHSSGLRHPSDEDVGYGLALVDDPERSAGTPYREKLEREVYGRSLLFEPGTDSHYSNAGYWLLGLVIERRGGAPLARDLDAALFAPNGLSSTRLADGPDDTVARGYTRMDGGIVDSTAWDRGDSDGDPAGGVVSTAADLLAFGELLFDGALVSEESLAAMLETTRFPSCGGDCELGLGLESLHAYPEVGYGKNGSLPGVDANLFVFPESDTALVVFANYGSGNIKDVFGELFADGG
jgi:D-alanyl-D-alanine carboxypeptidase